jgi:hypothetical protein
MSIGIIILMLYEVCGLLVWRKMFRVMLSDIGRIDASDIIFGIICATVIVAFAGPLIMAWYAFEGICGDAEAMARRIGGESREDRKKRVRREIAELERELEIA